MSATFQTTHTKPLIHMMSILNLLHRGALNASICPDLDIGSTTQVATIGYLYCFRDRDIFQKDLEAQFKLRRSTVSSMLNNLEKKGFIRREPVDYDARLKRLSLTEDGLEHCKKLQSFWDVIESWMTKSLTRDELDTLETLLQKIQKSLETELDPRPPHSTPSFHT